MVLLSSKLQQLMKKLKYKTNGETKVHISSERLRLQPLSSQDIRESGSPLLTCLIPFTPIMPY